MELPRILREQVEEMLEGQPLDGLKRAAARLSSRYRQELRDGSFHISDSLAAKAYLAARLPATYAAIRAAYEMISQARPDFAPEYFVDIGAGPGSALWAATDCWPEIKSAVMVEASDAIRNVGRSLSGRLDLQTEWLDGNLIKALPKIAPADLVTIAYVLDEIEPHQIDASIDKLWAMTLDTIVIVEPGTPSGWDRILAARDLLLSKGAHLIAPCPHASDCPLARPDWCHFSRRVARSKMHRLVKDADVPWEDEKYIFIAASRFAGEAPQARIIAPPQGSGGVIRLKLCQSDGTAGERTFSKRDGATFKWARRANWGDEPERDGE
ncbi:methyltransferase type 11 [Rhizobium sp. SEMIA 4085]|uniref:Ribosomal small subunit methyltransferase Rsm22 protein n=1 Tax=Rhizobium gallicum bv. gallicum R602sp TaxID=1041138 RepID=A0A0B4X125_9HYPH|nr:MULTISPECIES: small ribosomal subunit Rsm22 family protein [Rhizobium]AJD40277.1 ribosomal small subunit methyltransferase Rsm22 protein [Rhizobium gallicum bv. gallicum R602sp]NNH29442.1 methyltransferase type 11 [Rhizobium sp. SEMIA 4085]